MTHLDEHGAVVHRQAVRQDGLGMHADRLEVRPCDERLGQVGLAPPQDVCLCFWFASPTSLERAQTRWRGPAGH